MKNTQFVLSEDQTQELRNVWWEHRDTLDQSKGALINILLARKQAVITHRQLFMVCAVLANARHDVPEWCPELLYPIKEVLQCTD
jgi:hypothetical protein